MCVVYSHHKCVVYSDHKCVLKAFILIHLITHKAIFHNSILT